jgi:hypothetical protein
LKRAGYVNRMDRKRIVSQVFNNNTQGSRLNGRPKNRRQKCVKVDINRFIIRTGNRGEQTELIGRSPLKRRRSALDCSAVEEEGEEGEKEEEGEEVRD